MKAGRGALTETRRHGEKRRKGLIVDRNVATFAEKVDEARVVCRLEVVRGVSARPRSARAWLQLEWMMLMVDRNRRQRGWGWLVGVCAVLVGVWGFVLPRVARLEPVAKDMQFLESRGIDPSARYYTDQPVGWRSAAANRREAQRQPRGLLGPLDRAPQPIGFHRFPRPINSQLSTPLPFPLPPLLPPVPPCLRESPSSHPH